MFMWRQVYGVESYIWCEFEWACVWNLIFRTWFAYLVTKCIYTLNDLNLPHCCVMLVIGRKGWPWSEIDLEEIIISVRGCVLHTMRVGTESSWACQGWSFQVNIRILHYGVCMKKIVIGNSRYLLRRDWEMVYWYEMVAFIGMSF
jgi:hypothetical protein